MKNLIEVFNCDFYNAVGFSQDTDKLNLTDIKITESKWLQAVK